MHRWKKGGRSRGRGRAMFLIHLLVLGRERRRNYLFFSFLFSLIYFVITCISSNATRFFCFFSVRTETPVVRLLHPSVFVQGAPPDKTSFRKSRRLFSPLVSPGQG
ncbi:hypothetical protein LY78DRAFT_492936 [Colletotrichum sublineola]|nr:hypothetical protein LY78DRAFT_492936 [Colletotrichum sublineola]